MPENIFKKITDFIPTQAELDDTTIEQVTANMVKLLNMPDEDFAIIAPQVLQNFQQSLNNSNDKLALTQMLNATGNTSEDLSEAINELIKSIENTNYSAIKRDFIKQICLSLSNTIEETEGISKRLISVPIELCNENAKIPQYAHISDSGADVYAVGDIEIGPGEKVLIPTGIKLALPPGYEVQVRAKSGRALKTNLIIANAIGTIDQGYRDEIKVILENIEPKIKDITIDNEGKITSIEYGKSYFIGKGEKFCQLVLSEVPKMNFCEVKNISEVEGENREGGFGSTGLK